MKEMFANYLSDRSFTTLLYQQQPTTQLKND